MHGMRPFCAPIAVDRLCILFGHFFPGKPQNFIDSLSVLADLHEHHPEVGPPQVQGQELSDLCAAGQLPDVGGEALDGGGLVGGPAQAAVDGAAQALLHLGDVVVVDHQVAAQVLGAFSGFSTFSVHKNGYMQRSIKYRKSMLTSICLLLSVMVAGLNDWMSTAPCFPGVLKQTSPSRRANSGICWMAFCNEGIKHSIEGRIAGL